MDFTIDTWILYKAGEGGPLPIILLMKILEKRYYVNFDNEKEIEREYKSCIISLNSRKQVGRELIQKWIGNVISKNARFASGILPNNHERALRNKQFDNSDFKFVAVCYRGHSKILVAEESDYNTDVKNYLEHEMGIFVRSVQEATCLDCMR